MRVLAAPLRVLLGRFDFVSLLADRGLSKRKRNAALQVVTLAFRPPKIKWW